MPFQDKIKQKWYIWILRKRNWHKITDVKPSREVLHFGCTNHKKQYTLLKCLSIIHIRKQSEQWFMHVRLAQEQHWLLRVRLRPALKGAQYRVSRYMYAWPLCPVDYTNLVVCGSAHRLVWWTEYLLNVHYIKMSTENFLALCDSECL